MRAALKTAFTQEIDRATAAEAVGEFAQSFAHLERAHVLGQHYFLTHIYTHLRMLRIAQRRGEKREIRGQLVRLIAVIPGYISGWVPSGNTGGANVSALKPMPLPPDLAPLLTGCGVWRDMAVRFALAALAIGVYVVGLGVFDRQRGSTIDAADPQLQVVKVAVP